jgi:hypothetical protein
MSLHEPLKNMYNGAAKAQVEMFQLRGVLYYLLVPVFFFILLAPGLMLSLPAAYACNATKRTVFSPRTVTWPNTLLHAVVFGILVAVTFAIGAKSGFDFPFHVPLK